ncbi:MAG: 50S ribosomal protein L22 [Clostridiaceae bacterium]|nr:50S ribosomal protein L22 [Clostridiaceae bacterium]
MSRKVMSKQELDERRDEILAEYAKPRRRNAKLRVLTKKERKALGMGRDQGKATVKYVRMNPRKVNNVIQLIVGKPLEEAYAILNYSPHRAKEPLLKLLKSAEANAVNNNGLNADQLYVASCAASQAPTMKRIRARARGQATWILKRSCHINVVLKEREQEV